MSSRDKWMRATIYVHYLYINMGTIRNKKGLENKENKRNIQMIPELGTLCMLTHVAQPPDIQ